MTSGLFNYSESPAFQSALEKNPFRVWSPCELISIGITNPPYFAPGTQFYYSNTNSIILGACVERLFNDDFANILCRRMLKPLKLCNTFFNETLPEEGSLTGYVYKDGEYLPVTGWNLTGAWTAGQITSNVDDLHRYAHKSIGMHETLSDNATRQQRKWASTQYVDGITKRNGFHMEKFNNYLGHPGGLPGFSNFTLCNVPSKTTIVIMCNIQTTKAGITPVDAILKLVLELFPGW